LKKQEFSEFNEGRLRRMIHLKGFGINACGKGCYHNCKYGDKEALSRK